MRPFSLVPLLTLAILITSSTAMAQPVRHATAARPGSHATVGGPHAIGHFEDWTAATHQESGQTVCYAFTRASASTPALPGRSEVVLTVTERPGTARDAVAISAGFAFPPNAEATLQVDGITLALYTSQRSAFARDGRAVVAAFERGRQATARLPGPRGTAVTDTFPLRGFSPAYAAVNKACAGRG